MEPFTEQEARDYLSKQGIVKETAVEIILKLSGRIPVLLTTLASNIPDDPNQIGDPTDEAINRFLKWVGDENQRLGVLICASPRIINLDIVTVMMGDDQARSMFDFIKSMSFVSQNRDGVWVYHEIIRALMLRQRRKESHRGWQDIHSKLADYYAALRDELGLNLREGLRELGWQVSNLEWLYHTICVKERGAKNIWIDCSIDILEAGYSFDYGRRLGETIAEAGTTLEIQEITKWGHIIADGVNALDSEKSSFTTIVE